jgi:hypothetical protein
MDLEQAIYQARQQHMIKAKMVIATDKTYGVHPHEGIMQIHFDQLNVIAKHLDAVKNDSQQDTYDSPQDNAVVHSLHDSANDTSEPHELTNTPTDNPEPLISDEALAQSFTKKQLMQRPDWHEWELSQYKQLDQYWEQGMFSTPVPLPHKANALHMLWRYNLKVCGTRKSRMVCNGSPRQKGTVTIGHTYANALDVASERLFWAIVANEGMIATGADISNAFAEAPGPQAPLFLCIDDTFRAWWTKHKGNAPIPADCKVVRVHNAIQGHPESP